MTLKIAEEGAEKGAELIIEPAIEKSVEHDVDRVLLKTGALLVFSFGLGWIIVHKTKIFNKI